jgi:hypothetical protein
MLHLIYRSSGATNLKNRPEFFDKSVALASFLRAVEGIDVPRRVLFLNDGPIPEDRARLMRGAGSVVAMPGLGNSGSYLKAVAKATAPELADTDLVYLSEDDYLYVPAAFRDLVTAAEAIPEASYFTLYDHRDRYTRTDDADGGRARIYLAGAHHWRTVESTCMSYGARVGALRADARVHAWACRGAIPEDRAMWRRIQGYGWRGLLRARRHRLVSPIPTLATHLETEYLAPGVDWRAVAEDTRRWLESRPGRS